MTTTDADIVHEVAKTISALRYYLNSIRGTDVPEVILGMCDEVEVLAREFREEATNETNSL